MLSEDHVVLHVNDVHRVVWVVFFQILQDFELHASLIIVFLLVLDDLESYFFLVFVIITFDCDSKRTFAQICQ